MQKLNSNELAELERNFHSKARIVTKLPDPKNTKDLSEVLIKGSDGSFNKYQMIGGKWYMSAKQSEYTGPNSSAAFFDGDESQAVKIYKFTKSHILSGILRLKDIPENYLLEQIIVNVYEEFPDDNRITIKAGTKEIVDEDAILLNTVSVYPKNIYIDYGVKTTLVAHFTGTSQKGSGSIIVKLSKVAN